MNRAGAGGATVTIKNAADKQAISAVAKTDASVSNVAVDANGNIDVGYAHTGMLFWVIPIAYVSHAKVSQSSDGSTKVDVQMPWWSFLVSGASGFADGVRAHLASDTALSGTTNVSTDASVQPSVVAAVVADFHAAAEAGAAAQ